MVNILDYWQKSRVGHGMAQPVDAFGLIKNLVKQKIHGRN